MAKTQSIPAADHPAITAWLRAKHATDKAEAALKTARQELEAVLPPGIQVPDDYPVYWQESQRLVVADVSALPRALTTLQPDTKKLHAYAELHKGEYPAGVGFAPSWALKARGKK